MPCWEPLKVTIHDKNGFSRELEVGFRRVSLRLFREGFSFLSHLKQLENTGGGPVLHTSKMNCATGLIRIVVIGVMTHDRCLRQRITLSNPCMNFLNARRLNCLVFGSSSLASRPITFHSDIL
ncbi:hypothetical protein Peur_065858 [Populus x canadensis]|jgi:hypothetical protein